MLIDAGSLSFNIFCGSGVIGLESGDWLRELLFYVFIRTSRAHHLLIYATEVGQPHRSETRTSHLTYRPDHVLGNGGIVDFSAFIRSTVGVAAKASARYPRFEEAAVGSSELIVNNLALSNHRPQ